MFNFSKLFKKTAKKVRKNAALSAGDKHYVDYLTDKKRKALHKKGKRLTAAHKQAIVDKVKAKRNDFIQSNGGRSGWGFFEYYLLFHWMNSSSTHYYDNSYLNSDAYACAPDNPDFKGDGGEFGGGGASGSWDSSSSDSSSDDSCDSSDSSSSDFGGSSDFSGGSDFGGGGDF